MSARLGCGRSFYNKSLSSMHTDLLEALKSWSFFLSPRLVEGRIDDAQLMADRQTQPCIKKLTDGKRKRGSRGRMPAAFYDSKCNSR